MFGLFKKTQAPQRLREPEINEITDRFIALDERDAQTYLGKLYKDIGKENLMRVADVLNSRMVDQMLSSAGGDMEKMFQMMLSEESPATARYEMLMKFLMGKGVKLMDPSSERGMDRLAERAADKIGISVDAARNTLMAFIDMIMGQIPEDDAQLMLNNLTGSSNLGSRMHSEGKIDGSMETAVKLIMDTGISVEQAIQVRNFLYEELDKSPNIKGLTSRIKERTAGLLPPFF